MSITKTIGIIIFRTHGKSVQYLLLHHSGRYWNFPKGRIDPRDKNELDTVFRETAEETGIKKDQIKLVKNFKAGYVYSFKKPKEWSMPVGGDRSRQRGFRPPKEWRVPVGEDTNRQQIKVTKRAIFYLGLVSGGEVKISDEHVGFGWFEFDEALKKLAGLKGPDSDSCRLLKKVQKRVTCNL